MMLHTRSLHRRQLQRAQELAWQMGAMLVCVICARHVFPYYRMCSLTMQYVTRASLADGCHAGVCGVRGVRGVRGEDCGERGVGVPSGHPEEFDQFGHPEASAGSLGSAVAARPPAAQRQRHLGPCSLYAGCAAQVQRSSPDARPPLSRIACSRRVSSGAHAASSSRRSTHCARARPVSAAARARPTGRGEGGRRDVCAHLVAHREPVA